MQAILIATGENHKLLPLTGTMPAPMVPIVDRPAMVYAIELLARAGIRDIFVSLSDQANAIESYFGNGERWNVRLHYLLQRNASGSAGAIKRAEQLLTETFIVLPADALVDLDIETALAFHQAHGGLATAILSQSAVTDETTSRLTTLDVDGRLEPAVRSTIVDTGYIHTGAFIFEPAVLSYIPATITAECHTHLMATLFHAKQAVYGHVMDGYWNSLATFSDFQAAQNAILASLSTTNENDRQNCIRYPYVEAGELQPGVWVGTHTVIHPTARLTPPLFIGSGCRISRDVEVGPETIIGSGVVLDEGVTVQQSTVLSHTYVGQFLHLAGRVAHHTELIDVETEINIQIADPWLLSSVNPTLPGNLVRNVAERLIALLMLAVVTPLLAFLGAAIWITSGGPILNRVQRFGQMPMLQANPQLVTLFQFQTRKPNNATTALGRFLEAWELHRLPELWNVVYGDIGLVGVKPLPLADRNSLYETWQQGRFGAPAGFTGLWYTQTMPTTDADEICIMDAYQATTHTWQEDFQQLLLTPVAWFRRLRRVENHDQFNQAQVSRSMIGASSIHLRYGEHENMTFVATTLQEQ